ncbi:hypothetical protein K435DRAFT_892592 [Dendrothele bispora CBS 962.96]|uniref:Uncharacterized protein n=1 Tax=Dendrothele bispora (strain CBS 962.96) TaxID=1314807 RepID=A0A4S8M2T9_DENBC|nr:hypothetical protein K435DRAFT_892592 [Dendrothele bispora CBS 962.96]
MIHLPSLFRAPQLPLLLLLLLLLSSSPPPPPALLLLPRDQDQYKSQCKIPITSVLLGGLTDDHLSGGLYRFILLNGVVNGEPAPNGELVERRAAAESRVEAFKARSSVIVDHLHNDNASGLHWLEMWGRTGTRVRQGLWRVEHPWDDTPGRDTRLDNLSPEEWAKIQLSLVQYDRYEDRDGTFIERDPSFSGPMVAKLLFAAHVQWDEHHSRLREIRMGIARLKAVLQSLQQDEVAAMSRLHELECHIYCLERLEQCAFFLVRSALNVKPLTTDNYICTLNLNPPTAHQRLPLSAAMLALSISLPFDILHPIVENADRPTVRNLYLTSRQAHHIHKPVKWTLNMKLLPTTSSQGGRQVLPVLSPAMILSLLWLASLIVVSVGISVVNPLDEQLPLIARVGEYYNWSISPVTFSANLDASLPA